MGLLQTQTSSKRGQLACHVRSPTHLAPFAGSAIWRVRDAEGGETFSDIEGMIA